MVCENVCKLRVAKGISKVYVASKLGISLQGYSYIENGKVRLDVERLNIISKIFEVDPAIFFDNELTEMVIKELGNLKWEVK